MKSIFDIDEILYNICSIAVKSSIGGGIYKEGDRPVNSNKEDVVINSIILTQDTYPQLGSSNINIYVPDHYVSIHNRRTRVVDRYRLEYLSKMITKALRDTIVEGLAISIDSHAILSENEIDQHFVNIKISWNIQN